MKTLTPRRLLRYVTRCLRLGRYLADPGDGRPQPQIPARVLLWALVLGRLLREPSFHGVEQLVRSSACRALGVYQSFGDDTLSYFTERLDPARMRRWEIENQGYNDAKNRYGFEHICHHHANSVLISWLLSLLAMVIERLYRLRYLHRGNHPLRSAEQLCRLFWLSLSRPLAPNPG